MIWEIKRYVSIPENQALALRKRWLISNFLAGVMKGAYWGIGSATENYGPRSPAGYSKKLAREVIAKIRTDLDSFSEAEAAVLENHGYLLAAAAFQQHLADVVPDSRAPLQIPHPEWMDERKVRTALADSGKRKPLGRWWDFDSRVAQTLGFLSLAKTQDDCQESARRAGVEMFVRL